MEHKDSPDPNTGHHSLWLWSQFCFVLKEQQTPVIGFFFIALPKENISPAPH